MLALDVPLSDADIDARFRDTMRVAGLGDQPDREAYMRILVTRGIGELTYDPAACPAPSVVVIAKPHVNPPAEDVRARRARWRWCRSSATTPDR